MKRLVLVFMMLCSQANAGMLFDGALSMDLDLNEAPVSANPLTMACWFNESDSDTSGALMSITDTGTNNNFYQMQIIGAPDDVVRAFVKDGPNASDLNIANSTATFTAGTWVSAVAVFNASGHAKACINGGNCGTDTTNTVDPTGLDHILIAAHETSSGKSGHVESSIAECAVWNVELNDAEIGALGHGFNPLHVRPHALVLYLPMINENHNDYMAQRTFTETNNPTETVHPPRIY